MQKSRPNLACIFGRTGRPELVVEKRVQLRYPTSPSLPSQSCLSKHTHHTTHHAPLTTHHSSRTAHHATRNTQHATRRRSSHQTQAHHSILHLLFSCHFINIAYKDAQARAYLSLLPLSSSYCAWIPSCCAWIPSQDSRGPH